MSMSGGVMSNVALDAALDELGMLSTVANTRPEYLAEQLSRLAGLDILQAPGAGSRGSNDGMRTRASSMSTVNGRRYVRYKPYRFDLADQKDFRRRSRTRSENESELVDHHLPYCSPNQHYNLEHVPYIALPIDSVLSSNLFKSRSMESIDARTNEECVNIIEKELISETVASLTEVDSVSSGLHRLNVSE